MAHSVRVGKVVIVGVGLIGGSFALALKQAAAVGQIVGIGRTQANLDEALARGIVDRACTLNGEWLDELRGADFVLFATPVAQLPDLFAASARHIGADAVVSDAGSTKQDVIAAARLGLASAFSQFVPAHPIAGTEHTGARAAFATLFRERNVVLTPTADTQAHAVRLVRELWQLTGATVRELDAAQHDRIFAAVSHLPHVLAFALVEELARRPDAGSFFGYAASGFRDFTRIAASSPEMWRDIAVANREALLAELATFRGELDNIARLIAASDGAALHALFSRASAARRAWGQSGRTDVPADGPREP